MGTSDVSDVNKAHTIGLDLFHLSGHKASDETTRGEGLLPKGWPDDSARQNRHDVESLFFRKGCLIVPGSALSLRLADVVETEAFGPVWVAPVALVIDTISGLVSLCWILASRDAGRDDASLDASGRACLHDGHGAFNGGLDHILFGLVAEEEWRGDVQDVIGAFDGLHERLLVEQVGLDKLNLVKGLFTKGLSEWSDLGLVRLVSDCASDTVATILDALKCDMASNISRDTCDGHKRLRARSFGACSRLRCGAAHLSNCSTKLLK